MRATSCWFGVVPLAHSASQCRERVEPTQSTGPSARLADHVSLSDQTSGSENLLSQLGVSRANATKFSWPRHARTLGPYALCLVPLMGKSGVWR